MYNTALSSKIKLPFIFESRPKNGVILNIKHLIEMCVFILKKTENEY